MAYTLRGNSAVYINSNIKHLTYLVRIFLMTCFVFITACKIRKSKLRVFYGGARSGNIGGPLVKIQRLQLYFPQKLWKYNLVYALSNVPRLSARSLSYLKQKSVPLVLNQNGVFYPGWYGNGWKEMNSQMALAYHSADYVFWQSSFCRRAANLFLGEREGPGEILFNAVDINLFVPTYLFRHPTPFFFLITGRIGRHLSYRLESTMAGLAQARRAGLDAQLIISGWIEDQVEMFSMIEKYGLKKSITITGSYTQAQAPLIYQAAHAYITMKYLDPCPNAVIEALACGLPVLYSGSGGVPELVGDDAGIGLLVSEEWEKVHVPSADEIAAGMIQIANRYEEMSKAARIRAVNYFDLHHWFKRHETIFTKLLEIKK